MIFLIWKHGEESLKLILRKINSILHPTIKFTADRLKDYYRFACETYRHSSILRHFNMPFISLQKTFPYSQALRLNRICSNKAFFNQKCNELEYLLHERGYSERDVRQKILKARKIPRNEFLEKERNHQEENKLMFNMTYYPAFQNTKTILEKFHILLAPDKKHQKVFPNARIVRFRSRKS